MVVTWITLNYVNESVVEYGDDKFDLTALGSSVNFTDGGIEKRKLNIHTVLIENLVPGKKYSNFLHF